MIRSLSVRRTDHPVFARVYDPFTELPERFVLPPHRDALITGVSGVVLDVGVGTGRMAPFYADASNCTFLGVDPDSFMLRRARRRFSRYSVPIKLFRGVAESLPLESNSIDTAIVTFALCSVTDQQQALAELCRVIRPGGELRFMEHIHDEGVRGRIQSVLTPVWRIVAGGCYLDRDTLSTMDAVTGLSINSVITTTVGVTPVRPIVRGSAIVTAE